MRAVARLPELTVRDEHRLRRRAQRLRGGDAEGRARLDAEIARAQERLARRRASVPAVTYPALPGRRAPRGPAGGDRRPPGRRGGGGDRLGQDDAAAQAVPGAGPRRARRDRAHAAAAAGRAHRGRAHRPRAGRPARGGRRLRRALQRPLARGDADPAHDGRPAARRDPERPAAAPLRHDHRRRGARAQPEHRLPARLPRAHPAAAARPEGDHHLGHDRPPALQPPLRRRAGRRGVRPHLPGRGPLPADRGRGGSRPRPDRRDRRRRRGADARARGRRARVPVGRARDPRHRGGARRPAAPRHRHPAALRAALHPRAAARLQAPRRPPRGARHERGRDVADRAGDPLRGRSRDRADQPLLAPA